MRYQLILALIETAREFIGADHVKIMLSLRRDLVDRVFRVTRSTAGFQEEKYRGLYLPLLWRESQIIELLEKRVERLVRHRYTKARVALADLLTEQVGKVPIREFIFSIANRPRDVIAFFNTCISAAVDKSRLTERMLLVVVGEYSRGRFRALGDEWSADYPFLLDFAQILAGRPSSFKIQAIDEVSLDETILTVVTNNLGQRGLLIDQANEVINGVIDKREFLMGMINIFYRVGLVGLKTTREMTASWVDDSGQAVSRSQMDDETSVLVASKYAYALGVK